MYEKISIMRKKLAMTQERYKKYPNHRRRELEFDVGDKILQKVKSMKAIIRFGKKEKLRLRYIGPFEILEKISVVVYRLALSPQL